MSNLVAFVPLLILLLLVVGGIFVFAKKGNRTKVAKHIIFTVVLAVLASVVARLIGGGGAQAIVFWVMILGAILWFAILKKRYPMKERISTRIPTTGLIGKVSIFLILAGGVIAGVSASPDNWDMTDTFVNSFLRGDTKEIVDIVGCSPIPAISILIVGFLGLVPAINRKVLGAVGLCVTLIWILAMVYYVQYFQSESIGLPAKVFPLFLGFVLAGGGKIAMLFSRSHRVQNPRTYINQDDVG